MHANVVLFILFGILFMGKIHSQCPSLSLDNSSATKTISNFAEFLSNPTILGATYVNVDASADCSWDLFVEVIQFTSTGYTNQGTFDLSDIDVRALNACESSSEDFDANASPDCDDDPTRVCDAFGNAPLAIGTSNYIIGTTVADGEITASLGPCAPTVPVNDEGSAAANPTTHRFKIDFELDFSGFPTGVIKPGFYQVVLNFVALDDASNVQTDIETFVLNIEISSILVLKASTTSDISFNFLDLKSYAAGVAQYSATVLEVSSNVGWDLIGYGTSTRNEANANNPYWDNLTSYGTGGSVDIPLNALQINQVPANPFGGDDYSQAFSSTSVLSGPNTIEVARGSGVPTPESPGTGAKTIAGNWDLALGAGNFIAPGSYKIPSVDWDVDDFRYVMSYKIVPRLPAMFPDGEGAAGAMTTYARPGVYAMFVKYLLTEDQ